ncbi:hypothetical protein GWK47_016163 [Chionoecetes opilio]|uniref:Uncharacterized protein n=1 Tax=Chionoecetes opilio TaxID=41210 RepID=A0A8J4Y1P8_CHIOP|nr:hypothetical protein GWK47_016163 [Chionoecetes opilio]
MFLGRRRWRGILKYWREGERSHMSLFQPSRFGYGIPARAVLLVTVQPLHPLDKGLPHAPPSFPRLAAAVAAVMAAHHQLFISSSSDSLAT